MLAAPTRLQQKRQAVEGVYRKFRQELELVESGFVKPQIDRSDGAGHGAPGQMEMSTSALTVFNEGFAKFIEIN